jgi:hypothetical protein
LPVARRCRWQELIHALAEAAKDLLFESCELVGCLDDHAAPVVGVGGTADISQSLEALEGNRETAARQPDRAGELRGGERAAAAERVYDAEVSPVYTEVGGRAFVEAIDLGCQPAHRSAYLTHELVPT